MKIFENAFLREDLPRGGVGTVGNYDGIHRGQRVVLGRVRDRALELGRPAVVVTFDPHPIRVLRPDVAPRRLTTDAQKRRLLAEAGLDALCVVRFDRQFAATSASEFATGFLFERLGLEEVFVGATFTFGRGREGNLELLEALAEAAGRSAFGTDEVLDAGEPISSTRIRRALAVGDVETAARLLDRPYQITGAVTRGAGKGHALGWPTLNLQVDNELLPGHGVYVTEVRLSGGPSRPAVSNVGVRPTLHEQSATTVECHVLDFDREVYGTRVEVDFVARLRGERAFAGLAELSEQIGRDVEATRKYFAAKAGTLPTAKSGDPLG